jgi:hypothetical protein
MYAQVYTSVELLSYHPLHAAARAQLEALCKQRSNHDPPGLVRYDDVRACCRE